MSSAEESAREYLRSIMPTKAMVDHFFITKDAETEIPTDLGGIMCNNAKSTYDPEIGWVVCDGFRGGGVDGSKGFYSYESDGARTVVNFPIDRPACTRMGIASHIVTRSATGRRGRSIWRRTCWNLCAIMGLVGTVCIRRIGGCWFGTAPASV
mgnify:CR=1 FL=1